MYPATFGNEEETRLKLDEDDDDGDENKPDGLTR